MPALHTGSIPDPAGIRAVEPDGERVKVLVCEPHAEVRALLGHVVERLGYEAVYSTGRRGRARPRNVDVLLLEPADPDVLAIAESLRARHAELPIVCASILPESHRFEHLQPLAYLVKPFGLAELERALCAAAGAL
jgi:DNA-binding response OmpR family regulator